MFSLVDFNSKITILVQVMFILVDLTIDSTGTLTHTEIVNKPGFGCNEEALRLVKTKTHFVPAVYRGQFVNANKRVEVRFAMPAN